MFNIESLAGKRPGQRVLRVTGRLIYDQKHEFADLVRRETAPFVILDMSNVSHVDSYAVGSLVRIHTSFTLAKQRLVLVGPNERVLHVLTITRVREILPVYKTVEEAEEAFGQLDQR
jgi:anti-sigma B factor antagonist